VIDDERVGPTARRDLEHIHSELPEGPGSLRPVMKRERRM
jgi:hypothetical protein